MRAGGKKVLGFTLGALVIALLVFAFSQPGQIQYHKWRLTTAKREYQRLARGEYRYADRVRELFFGKALTWGEVESKWRRHEEALVELGFMKRVEYFARRGKVPGRFSPELSQIRVQIDRVCPWWSYTVSSTESSATVTANNEGLELWKKLAPSVGLQEDKPKKEGRRGSRKCGRRSRQQRQREAPVSVEWSSLFAQSTARKLAGAPPN